MNKRQRIWNKSGGLCWYCGCDLPDKWHIDHIEPIRRNWWRGKNDCLNPENDTEEMKVPACPSCNIQKGTLSVEEFREKIFKFINSLNEYHTQYAVAKRYGLVKETGEQVIFWFEKEVQHVPQQNRADAGTESNANIHDRSIQHTRGHRETI